MWPAAAACLCLAPKHVRRQPGIEHQAASMPALIIFEISRRGCGSRLEDKFWSSMGSSNLSCGVAPTLKRETLKEASPRVRLVYPRQAKTLESFRERNEDLTTTGHRSHAWTTKLLLFPDFLDSVLYALCHHMFQMNTVTSFKKPESQMPAVVLSPM